MPDLDARTAKLSNLDRRVAAGPKVVAAGGQSLEMAPDQVQESGCVIQAVCACGYVGHLSCHHMAARGLGSVRLGQLIDRLTCRGCGRRSPSLRIVDPYRSALDPD